ncbi:MAG TPA: hypothetical protein VGF24_37220 [Vicinamibacterales bacterium]|jgi:hypothetical protein
MIATTVLCPRCEREHFTPYSTDEPTAGEIFNPADDHNRDDWGEQVRRFPYPALSRVAPIYICSPCGTDEAMRDFGKLPPVPPDEWPVDRVDPIAHVAHGRPADA